MKRINVLLADDHTIVREGLRALLEGEEDIHVVGEADSGRQAVGLARKLRPQVVVMDIAMPLLNGIEATSQILKAIPTTKVIILSAHCDDAYVERTIAVGASGFLLKQTSLDVLARAIREVQSGNTFFSPSISSRLRARAERPPGRRSGVRGKALACLSPREMEVLQLVAEGNTNKELASELGISVKTVEKHRHQIMGKLNIRHTAGLTRYAIATGVVENSVPLTVLAPG